jgi:YD repeat-containing protein
MRKLKVCFVLIFAPFVLLQAQPLAHQPNDVFETPVTFNSGFIRSNKIKCIRAAITLKPDNQVIQDKGLSEGYQFDTLGRLTEFYRTRIRSFETREIQHPAVYRKGKRVSRPWTEFKSQYVYDTTFINYYYDSLSRLVVKRMNDGDYYHTWYLRYTNEAGKNNISLLQKCRETNTGTSHRNFRLGVQSVISSEEYRYEQLTPSQVKRRCLNDEGKVYKEVILNYDASGRLLDEYHSFLVSWVKRSSTFKYDSLGRLTGQVFAEYSGDAVEEKSTIEYDSLGRTAMIRYYIGSALQNELSFVYSKDVLGMYGTVGRRLKDAAIDIVKYTYEVYDAANSKGK